MLFVTSVWPKQVKKKKKKKQTAASFYCYVQDQDSLSGCSLIFFNILECANERECRSDSVSKVK